MPAGLTPRDWELILSRIKSGKCAPFVGAGACYPALPLARDIAVDWSAEYEYPLDDAADLPRVAQYLAIQYDPMYPKERILDGIRAARPPDFRRPDGLHSVLADLPLPLYITTNYDDFMFRALESRGKEPRYEVCRWNEIVRDEPSVLSEGELSVEHPVIFHLHGHSSIVESVVLTEDDYLDFLINISKYQDIIPHLVERALASASLLFVGYSLADWNFRVLFRGIMKAVESSLRRTNITVQLPVPTADDEVLLKNGIRLSGTLLSDQAKTVQIETEAMGTISINKAFIQSMVTGENDRDVKKAKQEEYLKKYFGALDMRVYWGTADDFAAELREKWEAR